MTVPTSLPYAVTNATATTPISVTWTGPGAIPSATSVRIAGVEGVNANGQFTVTNTGAHSFTLDGTVGAGAYVRGGGFLVVGQKLQAATFTGFDAKLAIRAVDKTGDVLVGQYSADAGSNPSIDLVHATSRLLINAPGAKAKTSGSGKFFLGDGDEVLLDPPRTRSVLVSCNEAFVEYYDAGGTLALVAAATAKMGVASTQVNSAQAFWMPLTRVHDGALLSKVTLYFFPRVRDLPNAGLPTVFPTLQVFRVDPSSDVVLESLTASGPSFFKPSASAAEYATSPPVGASGYVIASAGGGANFVANAGDLLVDAALQNYSVVTGGTFFDGDSILVQAIAPAAPATFYGANTNHSAGDVLSWATTPSGSSPTTSVGQAGLLGGLNAGYAQSLVYLPDVDRATIDVSTYAYKLKFTDDDAATGTTGWDPTIFTAVRLDFANITSMRAQ